MKPEIIVDKCDLKRLNLLAGGDGLFVPIPLSCPCLFRKIHFSFRRAKTSLLKLGVIADVQMQSVVSYFLL